MESTPKTGRIPTMAQSTMSLEERSDSVWQLAAQQINSCEEIRNAILKTNQQMLPGLDWIEVKIASITTREDAYTHWHHDHQLIVVYSFIRGRALLQLAKLRVEPGANLHHGKSVVEESAMSTDFDAIMAKWDALLKRETEKNSPRGIAYLQHITFHAQPVLGGKE